MPTGGSLRPSFEGFLRHHSDVIAHRLPPFHILGFAITWPIFATGIKESGDTQTRAIELTYLVRSVFHHQEIGCPEQRKLGHVQAQAFHVVRHPLFQLFPGGRILCCICCVHSGLSLTAHTSDVQVVLHIVEVHATHEEAALTLLIDGGNEALVNHLTTLRSTTLEILASALRCPCARLVGATILAELNELVNSVLLDVIVVRLFQHEHRIPWCSSIPIILTILLVLQLDDPDSLASTSSILLDHTGLEGNCLGKIFLHVIGRVIAQGVN